MYLYTTTDNRTMKRHWHFGGRECDGCQYRFECFTSNRIHIKLVKVDITEIPHLYQQCDRFKAEFHLPKCLRLGLYKQIADCGFWSRSYRQNFGDGFKLGAIIEEEDEYIDIERAWVKFPVTLFITGTMR